jgi:SAM-dependent methyltransferase
MSPICAGSGGFYDGALSSSAEAARLRSMAGAADGVSLAALGAVVDRPGAVMADVGAGESTSLGAALTRRNRSLTYVPIDVRSPAVDAHRRWGFDGRVGSATDLPLAGDTVDIVHARFVFGWLDAAERRRAVEEVLRVSRSAARMVLIDYDWSSAAGPEVVALWRDKLIELLSGFGFDPYYGQRLAADVARHLEAAGVEAADYSAKEVRATTTEPIGQALGMIGAVMASVRGRLSAVGLDDHADELAALHAAVADHGRRRPSTPITLPTMVATTVDLTDRAAMAASTAIHARPVRRRRADPRTPAGPPQLGVYRNRKN